MRLCCDFRGFQTLLWEGKCLRAWGRVMSGPQSRLVASLRLPGPRPDLWRPKGSVWLCVWQGLESVCLCTSVLARAAPQEAGGGPCVDGCGRQPRSRPRPRFLCCLALWRQRPLRSDLAFSIVPVVPFTVFGSKSVSPFSVGFLAPAVVPQGPAVRCGPRPGPRRPAAPAGPGAAPCRARPAGQQKLLRDRVWLSCFNRVSFFHGLRGV